ncbi:MAG: Radical SAM domain protein [Parcubacteria group bacterium GW2011_GWC2_45_7]|nr:MAG: Radical SAM domain protein [Parcubacteria group bacterium GW2011_GWC2_45_7]
MDKRILLIRTYQSPATTTTGGPVPPLDLLYMASAIMKAFADKYEIKVLDTGIGALGLEEIKKEVEDFAPHIVCLNSLIFEADFAHKIAAVCKMVNEGAIVLMHGQLVDMAQEYILRDRNIDYGIRGEGEITFVELLESLEKRVDPLMVKGIIYRREGKIVSTPLRPYIENLDEIAISFGAWDLINIKEYAKYSNWNGSLKEKFYMPILTSRGCPFPCTFCSERETQGKRFRARSPENVFSEIQALHERYVVKEVHIFDAVFNFDVERAKEICRLIIDSGMKLKLAFPHGIRADIMTDELMHLMRKAGTYKLTYGIETATPRLQREVKKNLDINQLRDRITKTAQTGIIVGGYLMLGFPTETRDEMQQTINFAVESDLDVAAFFKVTNYNDIVQFYQSRFESLKERQGAPEKFEDFSYYSQKRSHASVSVEELNDLLLKAQQRFYLNARRIWRGFFKAPHKTGFLKNLINAFGLILQSYLINRLTNHRSNIDPQMAPAQHL